MAWKTWKIEKIAKKAWKKPEKLLYVLEKAWKKPGKLFSKFGRA